jgi:hypothetical protein
VFRRMANFMSWNGTKRNKTKLQYEKKYIFTVLENNDVKNFFQQNAFQPLSYLAENFCFIIQKKLKTGSDVKQLVFNLEKYQKGQLNTLSPTL